MLDGLMSDYPFLKMLDEEALAIIEWNLVQKRFKQGNYSLMVRKHAGDFHLLKVAYYVCIA